MNLYRAKYEKPNGRERFMSFGAEDDADAEQFAKQWALGDTLLGITFDRALNTEIRHVQLPLV